MYIGIVVWFVLCGIICFNKKMRSASDKTFYYIFFLVLIVIMGLRNVTVGNDTHQYMVSFELASSHSIKEIVNGELNVAMEPLYLLFMKAVSWIVNDYYAFQFVYSFVYIGGMVYFIKHNTKNTLFATALFLGLDLYLTAFNLQRQMLSVLFSLLAWESMKKKKWKTVLFFWFFAFGVHKTAIVFILASLIYFFRKNKTILIIITLAIVGISIRFDIVIEWLSQNFAEYHNYYGNHKTIQTAAGIWAIWIIIIVLSVITILRKEEKTKPNNDERVIAIFSLLYIIPNIIGLYFNAFQRLGLFFLPFVILLFINFENVLKESYRRKYRYSVMICFLAYFILTSQSSQYDYLFCF